MSTHTLAEMEAALAWQTSRTKSTGKAARAAIQAMGYVAGRHPAAQTIARADYLSGRVYDPRSYEAAKAEVGDA